MNWKGLKSVDYIAVHCAATKPDQDIRAADIKKWHLRKGWFDIGYHYVICRDGSVEKGREDSVPGAHVRGFNHVSLGICLVGGVAADGKTPEANFTDAQYHALFALLTDLKAKYPTAKIWGHRDFPNVNKACPSFDVQVWWEMME
jgi:N-acetyl-anhydromuramyl-L-alanine amidase AmpD